MFDEAVPEFKLPGDAEPRRLRLPVLGAILRVNDPGGLPRIRRPWYRAGRETADAKYVLIADRVPAKHVTLVGFHIGPDVVNPTNRTIKGTPESAAVAAVRAMELRTGDLRQLARVIIQLAQDGRGSPDPKVVASQARLLRSL